MAEILLSPGVLASETDSSFVNAGPVTAGAAIIGPTVKGPVEIPTVVTSYSQYLSIFGDKFTSGSATNQQQYAYFTSTAVANYFANGGNSMLVTRVVSGSYTPATSSNIINSFQTTPGAFSTASAALNTLSDPINIEFRVIDTNSNIYRFLPTASGNYQDDVDGKLYFFSSSSISLATTVANLASKILGVTGLGIISTNSTTTLILSGSASGSVYNGYTFQTGSGTSFSTQATLAGGADGIGSNVFTLETITQGVIANSSGSEDAAGILSNGTVDNLRWQISNPNTATGTFDLIIRKGNDTTSQPVYATNTGTTFGNLSLDPYSDRFITKIIGDKKYNLVTTDGYYLQVTGSYLGANELIRVKSVNITTPNYILPDGTANSSYTSSLPIASSGSFGGALGQIAGNAKFYDKISNADSQGLTADCYTNMINLLSNRDNYQYNVILAPGLVDTFTDHTSKVNLIISNAQDRGDNIYIVDLVGYGSSTAQVITRAQQKNTSYAAAYWPWVQVTDATGKQVWVPASTMMAGVYAYNDSVSEPWFAPAGINRGGISTVLSAERMLSSTQRDTLYTGKINPIATFPNTPGVVVFGQKTLQTRASALDRVNVRRLLIAVKSYISQVANTLVFEQNTAATRNNFLAQVNPYLESVQQRQGLYAFKVIMDDTNNTPTVIDQNQMVGQIYLQPTKTAEFIYLNFNITPTGATFPA
jgi:hypothetical protein